MSSYNVSTSNSADAVAAATGCTLTLSGSIAVDDELLVVATFFTFAGSAFTAITCTAASGHAWTQVGTLANTGDDGGFAQYGAVFTRKATSGDASDVLTFNVTGTPGSTNQLYWGVACAAYTGFPGGVDVHAQANATYDASPAVYPSVATGKDGDWAVILGFGAVNGDGDTGSTPSGLTGREHAWDSGIVTLIQDSNGSVGSAGTTIGGQNQAFNANSAGPPQAWTTLFVIGLSTSAAGVSGTGSVAMHKMGVSSSGHAPVLGTGSIKMHKMGISIQARLPGAGSIQMHKMGISGTGHAPLLGTGSIAMHKMGLSVSGTVSDAILAVFSNTDANGVDNYDVTSVYNGPSASTLRVLNPTSPAAGYPHKFLFTLPVVADGATTFGDGLDHIQSLDAHNSYNLTVIEPSFGIDPWYADNPLDNNLRYETFMIKLVEWVKVHLASTGTEEMVLIGFSKSGIGGQGLILNNPTVFDKCISWDFPADQSTYDEFAGNSDANYGTDANFQARYRLSATNVDRWKVPFQSSNRIYIADGNLYDAQVVDYDSLLTSKSMLHTYPAAVTRSHDWTSGWVAPALASVFLLQSSGTGSIAMHKMGLSAATHIKIPGSGSIRMHKMGISSIGRAPVESSGSIAMHKMGIHGTNQQTVRVASNIFMFTDV